MAPEMFLSNFKYVFLSLFFLLIVGLWDDLRPLSPWIKLLCQLIAATLIVFLSETHITNLFGLFGLHEISSLGSYLVSIFLILTIINGINLLDGINTLSAGLCIMLSSFLSLWFSLVGYYELALFACTLWAATLAFLWYNWSPAKIFMGDSGAMVLGLSISYLILSFLQTDQDLIVSESKFAITHAPKIVIAGLLLPIIDTSRVFLLRILKGRSPLMADRNHLHHKFIDAGFTDVQTALILLGCQLVLILITIGTVNMSYINSFILLSSCLLFLYLAMEFLIQSQSDHSTSA